MALSLFVLSLVIAVFAAVIFEQQRQIRALKQGVSGARGGSKPCSALLGQQVQALSGWTASGALVPVGGQKLKGQLLLVCGSVDAVSLKQLHYGVVLARREGLDAAILAPENAATALLADDVIAPLVVLMAAADISAAFSVDRGSRALFLSRSGKIVAETPTTQKIRLETAAAEARLKQGSTAPPSGYLAGAGTTP
ncbi:MAG: hypothetical protein AAF221_00910 [Pseudomonadota bacterium]